MTSAAFPRPNVVPAAAAAAVIVYGNRGHDEIIVVLNMDETVICGRCGFDDSMLKCEQRGTKVVE